ncbi:MAG: universal stress protein [Planctomycetota bacterium]|jgi:nucleotide-binding universal stress UspA family protein
MSTPSRIVIPLDGSELADGILSNIRPLLVKEEVRLELLAVIPEDWSDAARRHLKRMQMQLQEEGFDTETHIRHGAALIAMSSHGRSGIARWALGSTAERVLRTTQSPVLVFNPTAMAQSRTSDGIQKILVPLDGSERGARILDSVIPLAKLTGAELVLLHVAPEDPTWAAIPHVYPGVETLPTEDDALALIQPAVDRVKEAGVPHDVRVAFADPAQAIVELADHADVDMIAMCSHGRRGIERLVFGSVSEKVLRHSPVPVLFQRSITTNWRKRLTSAKESPSS